MISLTHVFNTGLTEWVATAAIVADMVAEFGISKTHDAIQALYDMGKIGQLEAGALLDVLKAEHCSSKQAARMVPLL